MTEDAMKVKAVDAAPPEAARIALDYLSGKVKKPSGDIFLLAVLAGAYVAFGAIAYLVAVSGGDGFSGLRQVAGGLVFSVGLVLVIVAGAELFTGDTMLVINRMRETLDASTMWRFWGLVYAGNLVGALLIASLFVGAGGHGQGDGAVGIAALETARTKVDKGIVALIASGILANMLVCLAVWVAQAARTVPGKIVALAGPITVFVAAGFEHSVANMSIVPMALAIASFAGPEFWTASGSAPEAFASVTVLGFAYNLFWVTLGNVVGGASIGLAYWYAYLRGR
ncbi:formate/nitrite transporter family protein [Aureimonas glaciei]|uniref:Formate transporter FocA n=1 Tax=Aureimonas glaciei TaxID=1776957 RepID=A0A917D9I9_9HYPH|nr:formate/nitrite transporter family protein [Aureimonas glaciei]GGD15693.1 formate transporter FocA [Aureimonas glaciei]